MDKLESVGTEVRQSINLTHISVVVTGVLALVTCILIVVAYNDVKNSDAYKASEGKEGGIDTEQADEGGVLGIVGIVAAGFSVLLGAIVIGLSDHDRKQYLVQLAHGHQSSMAAKLAKGLGSIETSIAMSSVALVLLITAAFMIGFGLWDVYDSASSENGNLLSDFSEEVLTAGWAIGILAIVTIPAFFLISYIFSTSIGASVLERLKLAIAKIRGQAHSGHMGRSGHMGHMDHTEHPEYQRLLRRSGEF